MKLNRKNILFLVIIVILIIPQTRQPIQIAIHKVIANFSPSVEASDDRKQIKDYNWVLKDLDGQKINFKTLKGKVVLVNFWATWCPPCIAEMQSLQDLYVNYGNKIEMVFVSNEKPDVLNVFMTKNNYDLPVYIPLSESQDEMLRTVRSIPRTFLISKAGEIVIDKTGAANWNSDNVKATIDELLLN